MSVLDRAEHWNRVYATKRETEVSWFETEASLSLALIKSWSRSTDDAAIDIGAVSYTHLTLPTKRIV